MVKGFPPLKDEVATYELRLSLQVMIITAGPAERGDLRVGDGELGVGRVKEKKLRYECESLCL